MHLQGKAWERGRGVEPGNEARGVEPGNEARGVEPGNEAESGAWERGCITL